MNDKILQWADERNLLKEENKLAQFTKLAEEVGELGRAILKDDSELMVDSIGDIQVVLIILSEQLGIDYEASLIFAYDEIKNRKGKTINGSFIKEK